MKVLCNGLDKVGEPIFLVDLLGFNTIEKNR